MPAAMMLSLAVGLTSCSDDDEKGTNDPNGSIGTNDPITWGDSWGNVLRGDNMTLKFFPDHFAFYWEYTFDAEANPDLGLVIEGEFPDARFLSYNVYDDDEQTSYCERPYSVMDVDLHADAGYENPFVTSSGKKDQKYTLYVLPTDAPASISEGKDNVIWFDADVKRVCTILRYYIPQPDYKGGVAMPVIKGLDLTTGEAVATPERKLSNLLGDMDLPGGAFASNPNCMFFRAPFSYAYPNGPAEYCYTRNALGRDEVMVFNFKAPTYPETPADYATSDMRYWSVCVGNQQTYTPLAISDYQTKIDAQGFANYVMADKNSEHYAQVKALAEANGYNLLEWGLLSALNPSTRKIDMNTYNVYLNLSLIYRLGH